MRALPFPAPAQSLRPAVARQPARPARRPTAVRPIAPLLLLVIGLVACAGPTAAPPTPTAPLPTVASAIPSPPPTTAVPTPAPTGAPGTVDALLTVVPQNDDEQVRPEWPLDGVGVTIDEEGTRCRSLTAEELALLGDDDDFALGAGFVRVDLVEPGGPGCTEGVTVVDVGLGGVILTAEDLGEAEGWDAAPADARGAEDAVAAALETGDDPRAAEVLDRLGTTDYARQYAGVVEEGRRLLAVNAFCYVGEPSWVREHALFMDGGACFWQATVDPATGEVVSLTINGEA